MKEYTCPELTSSQDLTNTYTWEAHLPDPGFLAASVSDFKHAPLADCWDKVMKVGMMIEVENTDLNSRSDSNGAYWIATVLKIQGYKAQMRYLGFGEDCSKDFFMHLCSDKIHPVCWCAKNGKLLIPPKSIEQKYSDWKDFLIKRLSGARTLPENFYNKLRKGMSSLFRRGMTVELVDKMMISQVRVANVVEITGRRLRLAYNNDLEDRFWCHEESPLINPVGWAMKVGHQIVASQEYHERCASETYLDTDCKVEMFPTHQNSKLSSSFVAGMKLEAVDPLNLGAICVATVMKVLRFGYMMVRIESYEEDDDSSGQWFCYHASSPLIFPPGFCDQHNIQLNVPVDYRGMFDWKTYIMANNTVSAPGWLFNQEDHLEHKFSVGMKLECADLINPRLVCVVTISRVVGRLLKVHFDGWQQFYDQWMDSRSVDIYPLGWAELVGHRLELMMVDRTINRGRKRKVAISCEGKNQTGTEYSMPAEAENMDTPVSGGFSGVGEQVFH